MNRSKSYFSAIEINCRGRNTTGFNRNEILRCFLQRMRTVQYVHTAIVVPSELRGNGIRKIILNSSIMQPI